MKEFNFLNEANSTLRHKQWEDLVGYTSCMCENCSSKVDSAASNFINSAPYKEQKHINIPILIADLSQMHADKRRREILG